MTLRSVSTKGSTWGASGSTRFKAPHGSARFFALDSNYVSKEQFDWFEKELSASDSDWKIAFFHHPHVFVGETHGSDETLRERSSRSSSSTASISS